MNVTIPLSQEDSKESCRRQQLLDVLHSALQNETPEHFIEETMLVPWEDYTHPKTKLLYSHKRTRQVVAKGFALGNNLKWFFGYVISQGVALFPIAFSIGNFDFDSCIPENKPSLWCILFLELLRWLSNMLLWLYPPGARQVVILFRAFIAGVVGVGILLLGAGLAGYFRQKLYFDRDRIALGVDSLYHIDPTGRWATPWSRVVAVRWAARNAERQKKTVRWYHRRFPVRLLLREGGYIYLWGPVVDREWLVKVMELLIALHAKQPPCELRVRKGT